jgi:hypothetical protein
VDGGDPVAGGAVALLLRTAALGGFTAAAWLLSGHVASADPALAEEPPAVEITVEAPAPLEPPAPSEPQAEDPQPAETAAETSTGTPDEPSAETTADDSQALAAPQPLDALSPFADPAEWATAFTASLTGQHPPIKHVPVPGVVVVPTKPGAPAEEDDHDYDEDDGPALDFSGGSHSNSRSGTVSNQAPPEVVRAKAQARAARLAAKAAAALPPAAPQPAPAPVAVKRIAPQLPDVPVPTAPRTEPVAQADLTWTEPGQDAPMPAPQPAPVTATTSASSSHTDNSGSTRGALTVLTSRNELFPPATWSVEERRDGRSPGSLPGLPSTSPD